MQIKKSPRDAHYPEAAQYENGYNSDSTDQFGDAPEAFPVRTNRPGTPQPQAQNESGERTAAQRSESVIDQYSSFDGRFETEHDLRVDGTISGEVTCRGLFTVKKDATARVRVQTRDAHILGRFEGDLVCSGKLLLAATAHVTGTLKAAILVVEEGAAVSGTVETMAAGSAPSRASTSAEAVEKPQASREPATVSRATRRDLPSFAIVASDGATAERN